MAVATTEITSEPFALKRTAPCLCGSGKRFKSCCGSTSSDRKPPHGVLLLHNVLSADECETCIRNLQDKPRSWLNAGSRDDAGNIVEQREDTRVTQQIAMGDAQHPMNDMIGKLWTQDVAQALSVDIEWFEAPHVLYYPVGGQFTSHADSEVFNAETNKYHRVADRDLSMLLYLNSDFEGGELLFNLFHFRYQPRAGDLIVFPSDHRYTHQAQSVTAGHRYAVVSWAKTIGSPQALASAPGNVIRIT